MKIIQHMSFEALEGGRPKLETSTTGQEVVFSTEPPEVSLAQIILKETALVVYTEELPLHKSPLFSSNTVEGNVTFVSDELKAKTTKKGGGAWKYYECETKSCSEVVFLGQPDCCPNCFLTVHHENN